MQDISFEPTPIEPFESPGVVVEPIASFVIPVIADQSIQRVEILSNGVLIASIDASVDNPSVVVTSPNGGEALDSSQITFSWTASDLDEDDLTYIVQFSRDGGSTWETLAIDWPQNSLTVEKFRLKGTDNGIIRVMVSDGFNASHDVSDSTFTVTNNPPTVSIESPANGDVFAGVQPVFLVASAFDPEDGILTGNSLQWQSDIDGNLGSGESVELIATDLTEGQHTITVIALDNDGAIATDSVVIEVFRILPVSGDGTVPIIPSRFRVGPGTNDCSIEAIRSGNTNLFDCGFSQEQIDAILFVLANAPETLGTEVPLGVSPQALPTPTRITELPESVEILPFTGEAPWYRDLMFIILTLAGLGGGTLLVRGRGKRKRE